jgi:hypothetical protein
MSPRLLYLLTTLRAPHAFELYCDWIDAQRVAACMSMGRRFRPAAVTPSTNVGRDRRRPAHSPHVFRPPPLGRLVR